jgi:acetate kinase
LSVEWSVAAASRRLGRPLRDLDLVVAHLGGGCSVTAVRAGRSAWTSMGLTPLEGLMMTTRAGSIDPGAILLALRRGASVDGVERDLDAASGIGAIAGEADVRVVLERARSGDERAELAIAMFVDRAAAEIAGAATRLRRVDALVFTGGIGEHAAAIRRAIARRLDGAWRDPAPRILVVPAREDLVIAAAAMRIVDGRGPASGGTRSNGGPRCVPSP